MPHRELTVERSGDASEAIRERVDIARRRQLDRFASCVGLFANAHMGPRDLKRHCRISQNADAVLKTALARLKLSARAYHRISRSRARLPISTGRIGCSPATSVKRSNTAVSIGRSGEVGGAEPGVNGSRSYSRSLRCIGCIGL